MEQQQQLPNSKLILVFGIISIVTCCCYGVIGLPLGIVALVMAKKTTTLYASNPELYTGFQNVKTGKILAIIGIILNAIFLISVIWMYVSLGAEGIQEMQEEWMKNLNEGAIE